MDVAVLEERIKKQQKKINSSANPIIKKKKILFALTFCSV
jgi:TATA-binding protein-associated factor Taf7